MTKTKIVKKAKPKSGAAWEKVKRKWLQDLRSGEYKQARGLLMRSTGNGDYFCCLGVLATQFVDMRKKKSRRELHSHGSLVYSGKALNIPKCVKDVLNEPMSVFGITESYLIDLNDRKRKSFKSIANKIEQEL